jgi:hypothetical protein
MTVVAHDHGGYALHEIVTVLSAYAIVAGEVSLSMRVRIDEAR